MDIYSSDSDWDSSSDSGLENEEEADFLYGGQAQSILSSLEKSIEKIDDLLSFERGFVHGDTVFSANDPSGQMGQVVGVDVLVDLENVYGKKLKGINSKSLVKVRSFSAGDHISFGPWVGRVDRVLDRMTIVFDDGTKYQVDNAADQDKVSPVSPNLLEDAQLPYCPGQRVRLKLSTASKSTRWLCGNWKENQDEGTVSSMESGLVRIDWIASVISATNPDLPSPPSFVDSEKLAPVPCSQHASWQLGDWCKLEHGNHKSNIEEVYEITKTKTKADVAWQDGTVSSGVDSQTLVPATAVNSHEFWPGQFVLEKGGCDDSDASSPDKWGVVLGMDAKERTVTVQWTNKELNAEKKVEIVSSYELAEHPDYNYCFGDLVLRLVPNKCCECDRETVSPRECPDKDYLPFIGSVVGLERGAVEVKWATGITSKVEPSEISRVEKTELVAAVSEDGDSEDLNIEKIPQEKEDFLNSDGISNSCKNQLWESTSFYLPQAAIGFFTNIAATLLGASGSKSVSGSTSLVHPPVSSSSEYSAVKTAEGNDDVSSTETQIDDSISTVEDCFDQDDVEQISPESENPRKFKQFDMATDCTDHHFLASANGFSLSQVKRSWLKKVHQEWNILEKNLPETIYIRIFEERMDLMRAAIVGAPGTPYHDGLFLFDVYLPPEYPNEPPMVHYNSGGLRMNPNLYESGKVCLSLLNTWAGSETEVWSPERSTILQVLLSLQALVLNEKPYFNEAGYDQQVGRAEGEKNSVSYNEIAYLGTCKSMLYLLRKPLKHFEELVEEHFERRSQHILTACKAYIEGAPVGCDRTEHGHQNGSSTGFKIMLSKLFPKLVEAFSDKDKIVIPENTNV